MSYLPQYLYYFSDDSPSLYSFRFDPQTRAAVRVPFFHGITHSSSVPSVDGHSSHGNALHCPGSIVRHVPQSYNSRSATLDKLVGYTLWLLEGRSLPFPSMASGSPYGDGNRAESVAPHCLRPPVFYVLRLRGGGAKALPASRGSCRVVPSYSTQNCAVREPRHCSGNSSLTSTVGCLYIQNAMSVAQSWHADLAPA